MQIKSDERPWRVLMPHMVSLLERVVMTGGVLAQSNEVPMISHFWQRCMQVCRRSTGWSGAFAPSVLGLFIFLVVVTAPPAYANPQITWTATDVGTVGASSTVSFSSGTYTVNGAGLGVSATTDGTGFIQGRATGPIETIGQVVDQANTSPYAQAGFMIRGSLDADAATAAITVSPSNGVTFTCRSTAGASAQVTLGPSVSAPVWLRLVSTGTSAAGYYSADAGRTWVLVGSGQITLPLTYYAGFVVNSNLSTSTLNQVHFSNVTYLSGVPQRSANMTMWLRSDAGVVASSNDVSQWQDQSGNANSGIQNTGVDKPSVVSGLNGLESLRFDSANTESLVLGPGFTNFSTGASIFVVMKPVSSITADARIFDFANSGNNDNLYLAEASSNNLTFHAKNGSSDSSVTTTGGVMTAGNYYVIEVVHTGAASATISVNGVQKTTTGSIGNITQVQRKLNRIASNITAGGNFLNAEIPEMLIFNTQLSTSQRDNIRNYLYGKYFTAATPQPQNLPAPAISPSNAVAVSTQNVSITATAGAVIHYTIDDVDDPTPADPVYQGPFAINTSGTHTVKAIAVKQNFDNSAVATATIQIDGLAGSVISPGPTIWYRADNGPIKSGTSVTQWNDVSGNSYNATQSTGAQQPTFNSTGIGGSKPSITFDGTADNMAVPSGLADFTQGASVFVVTKPSSLSAGKRFFDFGNGGSNNNIWLQESGTSGAGFYVLTGSSSKKVEVSTGALSTSVTQVLSAVHNGTGTGTLYSNGVQLAQDATMGTIPNVSRTQNFLGKANGSANWFAGDIAEMIVYNKGLSLAQRAAVEGYLYQRYGMSVLNAPTIMPPSGMYSALQTVSMIADAGAEIRYTLDGSQPSGSSNLYTAPFTVTSSTTIRAIAIRTPNTSIEATVSIAIDPCAGNVPRAGLMFWLRGDSGVCFTSSKVSQWIDLSGKYDATNPSSSNRPTFTADGLLGRPGISFDATNQQYLTFNYPAFSDFTQGLSLFEVIKPVQNSSVRPRVSFFDNSVLYLIESTKLADHSQQYMVVNNGPFSQLTSSAGAVQGSVVQLFETLSKAPSGSIFRNGGLLVQNTTINPTVIARYGNLAYRAGYYDGLMGEVLLYNQLLTDSQRMVVEAYLMGRYGLVGAVTPPLILPASGTHFSGSLQVAVTAATGATIYYTVDGTTPVPGQGTTAAYNAPLNLSATTTVKAMCVSGPESSSVTTSTYTNP